MGDCYFSGDPDSTFSEIDDLMLGPLLTGPPLGGDGTAAAAVDVVGDLHGHNLQQQQYTRAHYFLEGPQQQPHEVLLRYTPESAAGCGVHYAQACALSPSTVYNYVVTPPMGTAGCSPIETPKSIGHALMPLLQQVNMLVEDLACATKMWERLSSCPDVQIKLPYDMMNKFWLNNDECSNIERSHSSVKHLQFIGPAELCIFGKQGMVSSGGQKPRFALPLEDFCHQQPPATGGAPVVTDPNEVGGRGIQSHVQWYIIDKYAYTASKPPKNPVHKVMLAEFEDSATLEELSSWSSDNKRNKGRPHGEWQKGIFRLKQGDGCVRLKWRTWWPALYTINAPKTKRANTGTLGMKSTTGSQTAADAPLYIWPESITSAAKSDVAIQNCTIGHNWDAQQQANAHVLPAYQEPSTFPELPSDHPVSFQELLGSESPSRPCMAVHGTIHQLTPNLSSESMQGRQLGKLEELDGCYNVGDSPADERQGPLTSPNHSAGEGGTAKFEELGQLQPEELGELQLEELGELLNQVGSPSAARVGNISTEEPVESHKTCLDWVASTTAAPVPGSHPSSGTPRSGPLPAGAATLLPALHPQEDLVHLDVPIDLGGGVSYCHQFSAPAESTAASRLVDTIWTAQADPAAAPVIQCQYRAGLKRTAVQSQPGPAWVAVDQRSPIKYDHGTQRPLRPDAGDLLQEAGDCAGCGTGGSATMGDAAAAASDSAVNARQDILTESQKAKLVAAMKAAVNSYFQGGAKWLPVLQAAMKSLGNVRDLLLLREYHEKGYGLFNIILHEAVSLLESTNSTAERRAPAGDDEGAGESGGSSYSSGSSSKDLKLQKCVVEAFELVLKRLDEQDADLPSAQARKMLLMQQDLHWLDTPSHTCARYNLLVVQQWILEQCDEAMLLLSTKDGWLPLATACRAGNFEAAVAYLRRVKQLGLMDGSSSGLVQKIILADLTPINRHYRENNGRILLEKAIREVWPPGHRPSVFEGVSDKESFKKDVLKLERSFEGLQVCGNEASSSSRTHSTSASARPAAL